MNILRDCSAKEGMTVLLVTHDSDFAKMASREIHMVDGKLEQDRIP